MLCRKCISGRREVATRVQKGKSFGLPPEEVLSMSFDLHLIPVPVLGMMVVLGTLAFAEVGYRLGRHSSAPEKTDNPVSIVESSILGLVAFLLGFSFSFASGRYETRLDLEQKEANSIGTAYLRLDLLDETARASMRDLFRRYVDTRLNLYRLGSGDADALRAAHADCDAVQKKIWAIATDIMRENATVRYSIVIQSLNDMFDNGGNVEENLGRRAPFLLVVVIFSSVLVGGICIGYGFGRAGPRTFSAWLVFAFITALVIFVVLDLVRPERGLIRAPHLPLVHLQESFK